MVFRNILLGAAAGAAGTTALNGATYLDMALRGRPTSHTQKDVAAKVSNLLSRPVAGDAAERDSRLSGLGALGGIGVGVGVGVLAGIARPLFRHMGGVTASVVIGAAAMAASDVPITTLGVSDARQWSVAQWLSDALPHLAYGMVVAAVVRSGRRCGPRTASA